MITRIPRYFLHTDERGNIQGLIHEGEWQELNLIQSEGGVTRGGHFHKETDELFIVLKGKIIVETQRVGSKEIETELVVEGDVFLVKRFVIHTFIVQEDSTWINGLSKRMTESDKDFYVEKPLIE